MEPQKKWADAAPTRKPKRTSTAQGHWNASAALRSAAGAALNRAEARVLLHLCSRANNQTGACWPSVANISQTTGTHERNVRKALRGLAARGLLHMELLHEGPCRASCGQHSGKPDRYPNGKQVRRQALLFFVRQAAALRAIDGEAPRAVAPGNPGLWRPGTPGCGAREPRAVAPGVFLIWNSPEEVNPPTTTTLGCEQSARATSPGGCAPPPVNPPTPRDPEPREDARAVGAHRSSDPPHGQSGAPAAPETQRQRRKESTTRAARTVVGYWARRFAPKLQTVHTTARLDVARTWLRMGVGATELCAAVHGASISPWYTEDPTRRRLDFILRDRKAISSMAAVATEAGWRGLPRLVPRAGTSGPRPVDSRAGSGAAIVRELSITPVNESSLLAAELLSQIGRGGPRPSERG